MAPGKQIPEPMSQLKRHNSDRPALRIFRAAGSLVIVLALLFATFHAGQAQAAPAMAEAGTFINTSDSGGPQDTSVIDECVLGCSYAVQCQAQFNADVAITPDWPEFMRGRRRLPQGAPATEYSGPASFKPPLRAIAS